MEEHRRVFGVRRRLASEQPRRILGLHMGGRRSPRQGTGRGKDSGAKELESKAASWSIPCPCIPRCESSSRALPCAHSCISTHAALSARSRDWFVQLPDVFATQRALDAENGAVGSGLDLEPMFIDTRDLAVNSLLVAKAVALCCCHARCLVGCSPDRARSEDDRLHVDQFQRCASLP